MMISIAGVVSRRLREGGYTKAAPKTAGYKVRHTADGQAHVWSMNNQGQPIASNHQLDAYAETLKAAGYRTAKPLSGHWCLCVYYIPKETEC